MIGTRIHVTGIVQGVGFRPFVYTQATQAGLTGWVSNTSAGVDIEVSGEAQAISLFIRNLKSEAPPLARIDSLEAHEIAFKPFPAFEIIPSQEVAQAFQPISPDISICPDCLQELFDPADRRYRYPFINCTNCGPRLTIIEGIPYDRPYTTMKAFEMCPECQAEYLDPTNRRFHAQPIACPDCGPQVWLEYPLGQKVTGNHLVTHGEDAIRAAQKLLLKGRILAIKGLGGFHLACDATNPKAVAELRRRKLRVDKPFALMVADIATVEAHCALAGAERTLLESRQRPIVIVPRRKTSTIAGDVAPNQFNLGVMLPYSPLHYLLFAPPAGNPGVFKRKEKFEMPPLVMTSGNLCEEPIATDNDEARQRLSGLADAFLLHDRSIRTRCDDSVLRTFRQAAYPLRRSRGYTPFPVYLAAKAPQLLATGAELKNTFCIVRDNYAFLSHHIGDMENAETYAAFTDSIRHYEELFHLEPVALAHDLHPDYLATRYALDRAEREGIPSIGVQHHHAHIAACMAECSLPAGRPVIGVAFDGTGYGQDGAIWGGEFLLADYKGYQRLCHLKYVPLPGGDTAIRKPARVALAYLWASQLDWDPELAPLRAVCAEERSIIKSQLQLKINSPLTSSMGRLFDAVASLAGVRQVVNYEAQAAVELEALCDPGETGEYSLPVEPDDQSGTHHYQINPAPLIAELVEDVQTATPLATISGRFHNSISRMVNQVCQALRSDFGTNDVVLSGGVWQNMTLLERAYQLLNSEHFNVYVHSQVPANDGGLSLGQALIAIHRLTG